MKSSISFIILFIIISTSCHKNKPVQLPPITQIGANTFGCKINGNVFVATSIDNHSAVYYYPNNTCRFIPSFKVNDGLTYWSFTPVEITSYISGPGTVNGYDSIGVNLWGGYYGNLYKYLVNNNQYTIGTFNVTTFDTSKKVVAGTFAFTLYTQGGQDSAVITEGRFDFKGY